MGALKDLNLVGYCGVYCGACAWCNGRWRKAAKELIILMRAYPPMPWEGKLPFDYKEFDKGLQWLYEKRYICSGCRAGGGLPTCEIRECVRSKQIDFCCQCNDFPCEKLLKIQKEHPDNLDSIKRMKEIGVEGWIKEQKKKVQAGYDIHVKEKRKTFKRKRPSLYLNKEK